MEQTLMKMRKYGHICLHLREILDARKIARNELARAIGARFEVVDKWCAGDVSRIDADILARICCVLNCQVQDILTYEED